MKRSSTSSALLLSALVVLLSAPTLFAFTFAPMVAEIELDSSQPRLRYTISNDYPRPIAVEISVALRQIDVNGEETLTPTEDLIAYPSQLVLGARESRTVMVEWTGGTVETEIAYRVIAEEVPVDFGSDQEERARIRMNLRYVTSLYVRPPGSRANLTVIEASVVTGEAIHRGESNPLDLSAAPEEQLYAEVLLENRGTSRALLEGLRYTVAPAGAPPETAEVIEAGRTSARSGVVLAGETRRVHIPLPERLWRLEPGAALFVGVRSE